MFKLGRLPGRIPSGLRDLTFYAAGSLPQAPPKVDVPSVSWGMDGNNQWGDCGVAAINHYFMADAAIADVSEAFPTDQQVVDYYLNYTGGADQGVILSDFLRYVRNTANGFYGHTVYAYAPVGINDIPTLQFVVDAYGAAYVGITVTQEMMDAVPDGGPWQPWTTEMAQGQPLGGHCVPIVGYDDQFLYIVTWGAVQKITYPGWHAMCQEAWAAISGEFVAKGGDMRGVSLAALISDLNEVAK